MKKAENAKTVRGMSSRNFTSTGLTSLTDIPVRYTDLQYIPYGVRYTLSGDSAVTENIWCDSYDSELEFGLNDDERSEVVVMAGYGDTHCIIPPGIKDNGTGVAYEKYTMSDYWWTRRTAERVKRVLIRAEDEALNILSSCRGTVSAVLVSGSMLFIETEENTVRDETSFPPHQVFIGLDLKPRYIYADIFYNPARNGGSDDIRYVELGSLKELMAFSPDEDTVWKENIHSSITLKLLGIELPPLNTMEGGYYDIFKANRAMRLGQYFYMFDRFFAFDSKSVLERLYESLSGNITVDIPELDFRDFAFM